DGLWFDNLRPVKKETVELWDAEKLFEMARSLQPDLIINNRCGLEADYGTPEQRLGHFSRKRPWESCITLGTQWAWKPNDKLKSYQEAIKMLVVCATGAGNLALNTNPMPDGRIEPRQVESFMKIGQWTKKYASSIYGTRGGPFVAPDSKKKQSTTDSDQFNLPGGNWWGGSTHKGKDVYLHVLRWPSDTIVLPAIDRKMVSHELLTGGKATVKQIDGRLEISVPKGQRDPLDTIIKISFDKAVTDIEPLIPATTGK
ncbi:MAG: alpha-L-fucosidase, partial [Deltaproteobacteria bacterium]